MIVVTDNIRDGLKYCTDLESGFLQLDFRDDISDLIPEDFLFEIFGEKTLYYSRCNNENFWKALCITAHSPRSQYDILSERMNRGLPIPDRTQLVAIEGEKFHGQRGRAWQALNGNIHLSCYLKPDIDANLVKLGFSILPARAVIETIDELPELTDKAFVKWVNDIFIDYAKVSGFLAATRLSGMKFSEVIFGIGLNVETNPAAEPTAYVPNSAALNDFLSDGGQVKAEDIFKILSKKIAQNYLDLTTYGYNGFIEFYRDRCRITGREGVLTADEPGGANHEITRGIIEAIGENMEIIIDGTPYSRGRLIVL